MALVCLEISCSPHGDDKYPVPTKIRVARVFADATQAAREFGDDMMYRADTEYAGQDVYFVLWNTSEELNLDRMRSADNTVSNCGMWLPDSARVYGITDLEVELVPPEKIKARTRKTAKAVREAAAAPVAEKPENPNDGYHSDEDGYVGKRARVAVAGGRYGRSKSGTATWNKFM